MLRTPKQPQACLKSSKICLVSMSPRYLASILNFTCRVTKPLSPAFPSSVRAPSVQPAQAGHLKLSWIPPPPSPHTYDPSPVPAISTCKAEPELNPAAPTCAIWPPSLLACTPGGTPSLHSCSPLALRPRSIFCTSSQGNVLQSGIGSCDSRASFNL